MKPITAGANELPSHPGTLERSADDFERHPRAKRPGTGCQRRAEHRAVRQLVNKIH
jgi:hypothetical protein